MKNIFKLSLIGTLAIATSVSAATKKQDAPCPLKGSLTRQGDDFQVVVQNDSDDRYSAKAKVLQFNSQGKQIKEESFPVTLAGKGSIEKKITATKETVNVSVTPSECKNLSKKNKGSEKPRETSPTRKNK